jgi:hypothetical protein
MTGVERIELWIGALLTLMVYSFLYRDNPFYKFAEHFFVGITAAYAMVLAFWNTLMPNCFGQIAPSLVGHVLPTAAENPANPVRWIPLLFGLLLLARLVAPLAYLSRWAMALVIGYAAGANFTRYLQSDFMGQVRSSMVPLLVRDAGGIAYGSSLSNLVLVAGLISALAYFFFSKEHTGMFGRASRFGIWTLMVAFGAAFGYTVMARVSLLIGRFQHLGRWLGDIF